MPDADSMEMLTDYILPTPMELLLAAPDLNRAIVEFLNDLLDAHGRGRKARGSAKRGGGVWEV